MPRLLIFAPCEKVIIGQGDNSASLITIIQELKFTGVVPAEGMPENATVPARFSMFCQWKMSPDEVDKIFEQRITIGRTDEKPIVESVNEFKSADSLQRTISNVDHLPFLEPGEYNVAVYIREKDEKDWPSPKADYPLKVTHSLVPAPVNK